MWVLIASDLNVFLEVSTKLISNTANESLSANYCTNSAVLGLIKRLSSVSLTFPTVAVSVAELNIDHNSIIAIYLSIYNAVLFPI